METLNSTHSLTHSHTFTTPSFIDDDSLLHECRLAADLEPVVGDMLHRIEFCLPVVHFLLERLDERRTLHRLRLDDVILQYQLDFVDRRQYRHALSQHRHVRPTILHSMPHLTSSLSPTTETIMRSYCLSGRLRARHLHHLHPLFGSIFLSLSQLDQIFSTPSVV